MSDIRAEYEARLYAEAQKIRTVRFLHNGRSPSQGFDCLGLVVYLQRTAGCADFPDTEKFWPSNWHVHAKSELYLEGVEKVAEMISNRDQLKVGDCPMFRMGLLYPSAGSRRVQHIGVIIKNEPGRTVFMQAIAGRGVVEGVLQDRAWRTCFVIGARANALKAYLGET